MAGIWADDTRAASQINHDMDVRVDCVKCLLGTIPTEDVNREGLQETPKRVAKMYEELFAGYEMDYHKILAKQFTVDGKPSEITVSDIQFYSMCEHHIMPFFGTISISYIPKEGGKVVGLSKLARLVECFARRLQIQERLGKQICDALVECLDPACVKVVIKAEHTCMTARGINKPGSQTTTTTIYNPQRDVLAKALNFGSIYGSGNKSLSETAPRHAGVEANFGEGE